MARNRGNRLGDLVKEKDEKRTVSQELGGLYMIIYENVVHS